MAMGLSRQGLVLGLALVASLGSAQEGGRYLIIAADEFVDAAQPLAGWKTKRGMLAKVVPVSQAGTNPSSIQSFIREAYNTWPVPPEYVLLLGAPQYIPAFNARSDCYYGDMSGDYKMEIPVGRLPAVNVRECSTMVAKVLGYERPLAGGDSAWFLKGCTVVREDNDPPDDSIYWSDSRLAHRFWMGVGYTLIDSLSSNRGHASADVTAAANDGRTFIAYRGQGVGSWWSPFNSINPFGWTNGGKMPVVVGATCTTISLAPGESMYGDKFMRAGSPDSLGGAVAYFGTTGVLVGGAHYRSACFVGFLNSFYQDKDVGLGVATLAGRLRLDSLYPNETRYTEWNLLGDPELAVWTEKPKQPVVEYDSVIILAPQDFTVTVRVDGAPFAQALVCVSMDSVVYKYGETAANGQVTFQVNPTHVGEMSVVVTGPNIRPFEGTCRVTPGGVPYVVVTGTSVDDFQGNSDGIINPGERFRLTVQLKNIGGVTAPGVAAVLQTSEPGVVVYDSTAAYGTILPDSSVAGDHFELAVSSSFVEGQAVHTQLLVWDATGDTWTRPLDLEVRAGKLGFVAAEFLDSAPGGNGNGRAGKNESGQLRVRLVNRGGGRLDRVEAVLVSADSNLVVMDSTAFYGAAPAGDTLVGELDWFGIATGPGFQTGQPAVVLLRLSGDGGTYQYADTAEFGVQTEQGGTSDPTGPDEYGYWCYDDTDTSSGRAPAYEWVELAPPGPGEVIGAVSDSDAATVALPVPFAFQYYGTVYDSMSVCSNGFIAAGTTTYRFGSNRPLPDTGGAQATIAPFWDDLNPDETGNGYGTAYQWFDSPNHRWIVEFQDFAHYNQPGIRETFQAAVYDPMYWPTPTGDAEVILLYARVSLNSGCTVGIEDHTETTGIQYLYNNSYEEHAAYLQAGRAIRFTTRPPQSAVSPWLLLVGVSVSDSAGGNGNGRFEAGETLLVVTTVSNRGAASAWNAAAVLRSLDADAVVLDSTAELGDIPAGSQAANSLDPFRLTIAQLPGDSILNFELVLSAEEYTTAGFFSVGISGLVQVEELPGRSALVTGLEPVRPNPVCRPVGIQYALASPGCVDLALFDATGRRVRTLVSSGSRAAGCHVVQLRPGGLSQGVYFLRLTVLEAQGVSRFCRKIQVVR